MTITQDQYYPSDLAHQKAYLLDLLEALDGVVQSPKYHPESDALYHSLQVFEHAYQQSNDPELWLAALLHDVGKAVDSKQHAQIGAQMLENICPERVVWLTAHHLDLMHSPAKTRQRLANDPRLMDLQLLRRWDLAGRDPNASTRSPSEALDLIFQQIAQQSAHHYE